MTPYTPEELQKNLPYHEETLREIEVAYLEHGPDIGRRVLLAALLLYWDAGLKELEGL